MENDVLGMALESYFLNKNDLPIIVHSPYFEQDEIRPSWYFRDYNDMPEIEKFALNKCKGRILDVGAGAGSHSLYLQNKSHDVFALDLSEGACRIMNDRGISKVIHSDIYELKNMQFDTILMLMNGIGLCGSLDGLDLYLSKLDLLLASRGNLIFDSSNLLYLYSEEEINSGSMDGERYYGEIDFKMEYQDMYSEMFSWLYIDFELLSKHAAKFNFKSEKLYEGENMHYLARIFR